jgi:hypothetical protein
MALPDDIRAAIVNAAREIGVSELTQRTTGQEGIASAAKQSMAAKKGWIAWSRCSSQ